MNKLQHKEISSTYLFCIFLIMHLLAWTLIPILIRYNLPMDSIEGYIWGHQLEWGYDKNPFLNGWLTSLAVHLGGSSGWMIYLFSQISVVIAFIAIFKLAKQLLSPTDALLAVLVLEGIQYYNLHAIDFNDNNLELSLWALTIYFFYQAVRKGKIIAWLATAVFAALGMMAKYYTAILLAPMVLFLFINADNRKQLKTWAPYLAAFVFLFIVTPHIVWLFFHEFVTVNYVFERTESIPSLWNHLFFPAQFAWQQFEVLIPALIIFSLLFIGKAPYTNRERFSLSSFDKQFLCFVGLGPFLLTILLSIISGIKLRAGWGMPLFSLIGILLLVYLKPNITRVRVTSFLSATVIFFCALLTGYSYSLIDSRTPTSANYPGQEIAQTLEKIWHDKYQRELRFVAGSRFISGNILFYSKDHPAVFIDWNKTKSPWIDINELKQQGAIFVWDVSDNKTLPYDVAVQFPQLEKSLVLAFNWQRNQHDLPPIKIGVAFLPPAS